MSSYALLRQVSREHDALGILMHDSDALSLHLARGGRVVDRYCSDPNFGDPEGRGEVEGKPALWEPLLGQQPSASLERAWRAKGPGILGWTMWLVRQRPDPHAVLAEMSRLLGLDPHRAGLGHRSLGDAVSPDDAVLLFRLAVRPTWERESAAGPRLTTEQLDVASLELPAEVAQSINEPRVLPGRVGEPLELRVLSWNQGRGFKGTQLCAQFGELDFEARKVEVWSHQLEPSSVPFGREGGAVTASAAHLEVGAALLDPFAEPGPGGLDALIARRARSMVGTVVEVR